MSTAAKLATGPRTPEGKAISSQNSFRHGCTGKFMLLPQENAQEFQELKDALFTEHQPATPTEHLLVERLVEHFWLSQRALRLQATAFDNGLHQVDEKKLALFLRYQTTHDRAFHKCLAELRQLQNARPKAPLLATPAQLTHTRRAIFPATADLRPALPTTPLAPEPHLWQDNQHVPA